MSELRKSLDEFRATKAVLHGAIDNMDGVSPPLFVQRLKEAYARLVAVELRIEKGIDATEAFQKIAMDYGRDLMNTISSIEEEYPKTKEARMARRMHLRQQFVDAVYAADHPDGKAGA